MHMSWQIAVVLVVIASAFMAILIRKLSLKEKRLFFSVGVILYGVIALCGVLLSLFFLGNFPELPAGWVWMYLLGEGILIPIAWLMQYKVIQRIGATNGTIATSANIVGAAILGILFLAEPATLGFVLGSVCILSSIGITRGVAPDTKHRAKLTGQVVGWIAGMAAAYAVGIFFEKQAIESIGVWSYTTYGWSMQFAGVAVLALLFGRAEWRHLSLASVWRATLLGGMTATAGGLFVYALSLGALSSTVIASSGKIAFTMLLAALLLGEHNALSRRLLAFALSVAGLVFIAL